MALPRIIMHLDMDAFFASVEIRDDPTLKGKPLIIGHPGKRGVVSTCSYEARRFGVHSAMPSVVAQRKCPDAIWLSGRMSVYSSVSRQIREILQQASPTVEPLSIDEAFLDLTGIAREYDHAADLAQQVKSQIDRELQLPCSVGLAPNKFLAKIASDLEKPDGLVVVHPDRVQAILWPLPIERLWGVGPSTAKKLQPLGARTIGDLATVSLERLSRAVGNHSAARLSALAQGKDDREVSTDRESRSISEERTYADDLHDLGAIHRALLARADGVAVELRREGLTARTVQIKVRAGDFTTWTRAHTLAEPTDLAEPLFETGCQLFERVPLNGRGVRLLGLGVRGLVQGDTGQPSLFISDEERKARSIASIGDTLRERIGRKAVTRARLLRRPDRDDDPSR